MNAQRSPWAALSALCIGFFMVLLDQTIVMVAIPAMITGLNASLNSIVWVTSIYLLTYAVPILFASRLGDRFGPKRLFLIGLFIFTACSLWCGLSGNAEMLILARALQGLGAAAMTPQTLSFITHLFPGGKRGAAMGMWGGVAGLATITGPLLGGLLVDNLGWEWIFFINVPIGVVGFVLAMILVPNWQPRRSHKFDIPGIILSAAGLGLLIFGIQNGQQYHWSTVAGFVTIPMIIGAGIVLLIVFAIHQKASKSEPLLPLRVFRNRNFSVGNLANITLGFTLGGMFIPVIIYLQSVLGMSPLASGVLTAPMSLMSGIIAPFVGKASDRFNPRYLVMIGLGSIALGFGILTLQAQPNSHPWSLIAGFLVVGVGMGFVFSPLTNITTRGVQHDLMGAASGIFNTSRQLGAVFGAAAVGVLLQARAAASLHDAAVARAGQLPAPFRQQFIDGFSHAANGAGEFGGGAAPPLPPGIPASVAHQVTQIATDTFRTGFTHAAMDTLLLPIGVLVVGVLLCLFMKHVTGGVRGKTTVVPAGGTVATGGSRVVTGTVRAARTGAALPGAMVTVANAAGEVVRAGTAGPDGRYHVDGLDGEQYTIVARADGHSPAAVAVHTAAQPAIRDVTLEPAGGLFGTASAPAAAAVADARVTVLDATGAVIATATTDERGRYAVSDLHEGEYTVVVSGYPPTTTDVVLSAGAVARRDVLLSHDNGIDGPQPVPTASRNGQDRRPAPDGTATGEQEARVRAAH